MSRLSVSKPIDSLLDGGLEPGCITNFYGPSASGKTNIVHCACISCIATGKQVAFVDTEGSFSPDRLSQIEKGSMKLHRNASTPVTDSIIFFNPKNWAEQNNDVRSLEQLCQEKNIGLIVVDSISAIWRLTINDNNYQLVNRELATQLSLMSKLARDYKIPVLITNQVYDDINSGRIELSAKNIVKWWSKNLIELMHTGQTSHRYAIIRKARSIEENKQIEFKITSTGLDKTSGLRLF
jgi:DNA repair protein RadB